jgi:hypothetical protein
VSSRIARTTQRNPVTKKEKKIHPINCTVFSSQLKHQKTMEMNVKLAELE